MITLPELALATNNGNEKNLHRSWRSIEEFSETPEFEEFVRREYPSQESVLIDPISRRNFLKLMAASLALSGAGFVNGCVYMPKEEIVPYIKPPSSETLGKPKYFATAMTLGGSATGLLIRSDEGRPTKASGNPRHPASLGATDIFAEASILGLYDPDRSQAVLHNGEISSWSQFLNEFSTVREIQKQKKGAGLRILTETVVSPTLANQLQKILSDYPEAKWHQYDRTPYDNAKAGSMLAFGRSTNVVYKFDKADRIISFDADFLDSGGGKLRYTRDFISRRKPESINRFYAIESTPTLTGAQADHLLKAVPSRIIDLLVSFANIFGIAPESYTSANLNDSDAKWIAAAAKDITDHAFASIILCGNEQPAWVHHLVHTLNFKLGNIGKTVFHTEPVEANPVIHSDSLQELSKAMSLGSVDMLIIIGGNPVYTSPVDFGFAECLTNVGFSVH